MSNSEKCIIDDTVTSKLLLVPNIEMSANLEGNYNGKV